MYGTIIGFLRGILEGKTIAHMHLLLPPTRLSESSSRRWAIIVFVDVCREWRNGKDRGILFRNGDSDGKANGKRDAKGLQGYVGSSVNFLVVSREGRNASP